MANQVPSFESRTGYITKAVAALADNGTDTITLPATCAGRFITACKTSEGVVIPLVATGGTGYSVAYNSTTKVVTFKNETGGALTGTFEVMVLD